MMQALMELREMLCGELEEIVRKARANGGEMSAGDLAPVHELTDTIKNIDKIMMLDGGQSQSDGMWEARGGYSRDGGMSQGGTSYRGGRESYRGSSYANRGQHYVRGHYSRSDGVEQLRGQLDDMMRDGRLDDRQRMAIKHAMEALEE